MEATIPSVKDKDQFAVDLAQSVGNLNFTNVGEKKIQKLLHNLFDFYGII